MAVASVGRAVDVEPHPVSAAPHVKCELQMTVWCIREGAKEIVIKFSQQGTDRRAWIIRGFFQPQWPLVVLEPRGCREGVSDAVSILSFDDGVEWGQESWNRIRVRLKQDGSCDLDILVPYLSDDESGEAFFGGLALIQACTTSTCEGPSIGRIRGELEERWRAATRPRDVEENRRYRMYRNPDVTDASFRRASACEPQSISALLEAAK